MGSASYNSLRLIPYARDPHGVSRAMLESTITDYYLYHKYPKRTYFSPALKAIADKKRDAEKKIVDAYGYYSDIRFVGMRDGYRVFRADHKNGAVEWMVRDDGKQITALTWKKI